MSPRLRIALPVVAVIVAVVTAFVSTAELEAQRSFPLVCRGGGDMVMRFQAVNDGGWTQLSIFFRRGAAGGDESLRAPGECAFLDRGVAAEEPDLLVGTFRGVRTTLDVQADGQLRGYDFSGTDIEKAGRLRQVIDAVRGGDSFTLQVRIAGSGDHRYFEVVRVGP